jgi:phosphate uptake regulator
MITDDLHCLRARDVGAARSERSPHEIGAELRATDHGVNAAERDIRRELVVHASVHGAIDTPAILIYMSIVKDIERIGDYAKNLFDLAVDGADLSTGLYTGRDHAARERGPGVPHRGCRGVPRPRRGSLEGAAAPRRRAARPLRRTGLGAGPRGAPRRSAVAVALTHRYLKRIVAHGMNVLSAVVMPVDRLDYFDEDPEDRS